MSDIRSNEDAKKCSICLAVSVCNYNYGDFECKHFCGALKENTAPSNKPKIITMCGSSKFCGIMAVCAWILERDELAITMGLHLLPVWYNAPDDHLAESENCAEAMDELHLRKIDLSDEIFVVNFDDYIGESTAREIAYAEKIGLPVRYFGRDLVGQQCWRYLRDAQVRKNPQVKPRKIKPDEVLLDLPCPKCKSKATFSGNGVYICTKCEWRGKLVDYE